MTKSGKAAYDETFHPGVNMIRSDGNSRGKSTIADLIFFALGGDLTEWKREAGICDQTFAEVALNGSILTLRREISVSGNQHPMWLFFGPLRDASVNAVEGWMKFPYARYGERLGFSQVLFNALAMPEVPSDDANITMHQLLRLMYVDQMTPVSQIFRMEERDAPNRRQAIGDLLCGVLDARIYPSQIKARQLDREYSEATSQLSALLRVLRRVDENLDFSDLISKTTETEARRQQVLEEIENLRVSRYARGHTDDESSTVLEALRRDLDRVSRDVVTAQREIDRLALAMEDSVLLVTDLERNLKQIDQSQATGELLAPFVFSFCPSCMSAVEPMADEHSCHLCKKGLDESYRQSRYARLRNEVEMQLRESQTLQASREKDRSALSERLNGMQRVRNFLSNELLTRSRHHLTDADSKIEELTRSVGYLDRELVDLERERRMAGEVTELADKKKRLNDELTILRRDIAEWISAKERRQASIYGLISRLTAEILADDLPSDIEPVDEHGVRFDFADNDIVVNDKRGYSASSRTIIKNAFHLALLFASCLDERLKYPRFALLDNIEDKGMTPARSHNFQRLIVDWSEDMDVEHQIIFTTSMPDDTLENSKYTVGLMYSETQMSLNVG
ncbi:hypothetical protein RJJ37_07220 [Rhizobium redzepovicii]|uniref:Rad50/SbcC-type AAA domain-containing protein n=1 Tax=Rhizobium redzepovicii TaxID=2867518 RepID=A0AAW8NX05_9HYPH|nr:hypothetical protein [Rhizobium redzepovicii]MDR9759423.1 hypothetical protein [Rhizobium redzepovicii]